MTDNMPVRTSLLRPLILVGTAVLTFGALAFGQASTTVVIEVNDPAPADFFASRDLEVEDVAATEAKRQTAYDSVDEVYVTDPSTDEQMVEDIRALFTAVRDGTVPEDAVDLSDLVTTTTTIVPPDPGPDTVATTISDDGSSDDANGDDASGADTGDTGDGGTDEQTTTTTVPIPRTADLTGRIYVDVDEDNVYSEDIDGVVPGVDVVAIDSEGERVLGTTTAAGLYTIRDLAAGHVDLLVDVATVPDRLSADIALLEFETTAVTDDLVEVASIPFRAQVRPTDLQVEALLRDFPDITPATLSLLADIASADVIRAVADEAQWLDFVEAESVRLPLERLEIYDGITPDDLVAAQADLRTSTGLIPLPGADELDTLERATAATVEIASTFLVVNKLVNVEATEAARQQAYDSTDPTIETFEAGTLIVRQGGTVDELTWAALDADGVFVPAALEFFALGGVVALLITVLAVYISRFRPVVWSQMRRLTLFGLLVALSAVAARGIEWFTTPEAPEVGYLIPAAAFGLMAAILFDARIAMLVAIAMGAVTAIATGDAGFVLFSTLATVAPVPWASAISARRELRSAVVFTTVALAAMAASIAWFFHGSESAIVAAGYGALNGVLSGLVGTAALSFLEIMFDVTTNLRLLDLTDRNHAALQLLEEKAIGTFNHSLMVGTLADKAARAIGANNLLARAAAYYHDLGKTENPQFFIENQFGALNPHDRLPPAESAAIIRQHVIDGKKLARRFDIPAEVAEGVVSHHGDGVMRYFYNKAVERDGEENVDIDDFRHAGHKPRSKEMAIVMMADSVEGACRAIFQEQEPSAQAITDVVERIVGEKVADGQLSASALTLADLTAAKAAFVDSLVGHYHQRIPYPNFPELDESSTGSITVEETADEPDLAAADRPANE